MKFSDRIVEASVDRPVLVTAGMVLLTLALALLAALPSLAPQTFSMLYPLKVDTDPENMLSKSEPVRIFHEQMREALSLYDMVVLGVVNEKDPNGVFTPASLGRIYELAQYAKTLRGEALGVKDPDAGVIEVDVIAPSTVDNIEQGGPGEVKFEWLMPQPPKTEEEAVAVRTKAQRVPFLDGTLVSEDGKALCLYLPLTSKDLSYKVYRKLNAKIDEIKARNTVLGDEEQYYITGLPVAEDTFGVEMFIQMAISAPTAMLVIFLLMLYFFRKLALIIAPMILAVVSCIITMGLLIATGNTIHIMSSMIPIFIMPIAVLDSIHILSEFFDHYQRTRDRRKTIIEVMRSLYTPMLYTSLTSMAGFASLALTPIPPVQVFGLYVAFGIMIAWVFTVTFIPAYVMFIPERRLQNFGTAHVEGEDTHAKTFVGRLLHGAGEFTYNHAKLIIGASAVIAAVAIYGISLIHVNDNPTKWFRASHPIRVADRVLNAHFGGTYMAYLALFPQGESVEDILANPQKPMADTKTTPAKAEPSVPQLPGGLGGASEMPALPGGLGGAQESAAPTPAPSATPAKAEIFKNPEVLRYMNELQQSMLDSGMVGKSNSLADIVKTVHRELIDGKPESFRVPETSSGVAQCLLQYQSSHRPNDLWHFTTPDYRVSSIWVQLQSGDNLDMQKVVAVVADYMKAHPPVFTIDGQQVALRGEWFGSTYINVIWQEKMVKGMLTTFLGSFLVVLLMMIILFRSGLWGILSMIPLTITIGLIYSVIGFIGKDYDMPVAVLSSLTLGLAVDFAIHFLVRARALYAEHGSWEATHAHAFGEPARAITRNIIVIAVGFLPLLLAPLVPYNTVGIFLAAILSVSGVGTLLLLPALVRVFEPLLFPKSRVAGITCRCGTCMLTAVVAVGTVWVNVVQFLTKGVTTFTIASIIAVPVLLLVCFVAGRRSSCKTP